MGLRLSGKSWAPLLPGLIGSDRELYLQSGRLRSILPGGARLAAHPRRGGILHGKDAQEEA